MASGPLGVDKNTVARIAAADSPLFVIMSLA
jgi:hypothetical protein